jgi:SNF2 family DNA or RNA helicase
MQQFIVSEQQKALVLNPAQPEMLTNLLPMAKAFDWNGHRLYAVPHDIDVVRLLRNVGVPAPSPILHQYHWPGRFQPFHAQRATAEFLTLNPRAFVLNDMGTGKTMSVLWAYDYLRSIGQCRRMLVAAPLSTLERTWGDEIFRNFPHLTFAILHGAKERRRKLLNHPFDVYIINHDGIETILDDLKARDDIDLIVPDEVAVYRNAQTDRYKALEELCKPVERRVWGLTGTPIPNAPTDAWAQVKLVNPGRVPKYFGRFRDQVMNKFGPYKWVAKPNAIATVQEIMQPAIRFSRDDCVDLPETVYQTRHIELTPGQRKVYDELRNRMKSEADEGTVRAVNEADKLMKLVQVAAGAVYTTEGEVVDLENGPRLREVKDIIEQSPGKVIVFVPFIAALKNLREELAKDYPTELVYGGTSKTDRDTAFWRFQNLPKSESRVLVANAAAMSHGLTLTEASTVVWVAPTTSHETFDQANHRIIRPGQKNKTLVVMLEGTPVERQIYARLQQRQAMQGLLLEAVRDASD